MALSKIGSVSVDLYNLSQSGNPSDNSRVVRETFETINKESVTIKTVHKKRFSFDLEQIPTADRDTLNTLFNSEYFSFTPTPYDTTTYTVKVIEQGNWDFRDNTTTLHDIRGITLEVIDLESGFFDLTNVRDNSFLYKNLGIGELNGAETILTVYFNASTGTTYANGGRGTSSLPFPSLEELQTQMTTHNIRFMKYEIAFNGIDQIDGYSRNYFYADGFSSVPMIKDFTSLITGTITAMTLYDRTKDDVFSPDDIRKDWYKKADTSWFQEVGEFPERVLIVCADSLYIIDLDTQTVWMEFESRTGGYNMSGKNDSLSIIHNDVFMKNGNLFICNYASSNLGNFIIIRFFEDNGHFGTTDAGGSYLITNTISERNSAISSIQNTEIGNLILRTTNSVHANVINGTLYAVVGTDGGLSQINMDSGVVYDWVSTQLYSKINNCKITSFGDIYISHQQSGGNTAYYGLTIRSGLLTTNLSAVNYFDSADCYWYGYYTVVSGLPLDNIDYSGSSDIYDFDINENSSLSEQGQNKILLARETKLTILHENSTPSEGWYQYITKDYNTGLLYGDTDAVGCYLNGLDSVVADRTYRGNTLTNNGTVAISSDSTAPFGVSASFDGSTQYLTQSSISFGGESAILGSAWVKLDDGIPSASNYIMSEHYDSSTDATFGVRINTSGKIDFLVKIVAGSMSAVQSNFTFSDGVSDWTHIVFATNSNNQYIYVNGVLDNSGSLSFDNSSITSAVFSIGSLNSSGSYLGFFDGEISQVKILNTLPNDIDSWVKNEYELGRNSIGQTATLKGNSNQVNSVSVLGDKILLSTGDSGNTGKVQSFNGNGSISLKDYDDTVINDNMVVSNYSDVYYSKNTDATTNKLTGYIVGKDVFSELYGLIKNSSNDSGSGTFSSGGTTQTITIKSVNPSSKVFVQPTETTIGRWFVSDISDGSFTVSSTSTESSDVDFDYLIINE